MKAQILALIAISSFVAGLVVAGVSGYGPLAYISYHIIVSQQQAQAQIIPAYINLGNLTPGENGSVSAKAVINISSNGTFTIQLLHSEKLQKDFSEFVVKLSINNTTNINLTPENNTAELNLTKGVYTVLIDITFQVSQHPQGDLNVMQEPLLIIHPSGEENVNS